MASFVAFIAISVCCCMYATEAQTVPEAGFVAMDRVWNHELNLPTSDDLCGVRVNLFAWWKPADAPESSGNYTIDLEFKHPNFKETINGVMEIQHDVHNRKNTTKAINICLSRCPTLPSSPFFTIHAASDNIQPKNRINLQITSEKLSTRSYVEFCSDRKTLINKNKILEQEKEMWISDYFSFRTIVIVIGVFFCGFSLLACYWRQFRRPGVRSDVDPNDGGLLGSRPHSGGRDGPPIGGTPGGRQADVDQSSEGESSALTDIVTKGSDNRPRGGNRKPGTKKNKPHDE